MEHLDASSGTRCEGVLWMRLKSMSRLYFAHLGCKGLFGLEASRRINVYLRGSVEVSAVI
jgi:hypothetical protein